MSSPALRSAPTIAAVSGPASGEVTARVVRPSHPGSSTPIVVTPAGTDGAATSGTRQMPSPAATRPNRAGHPRTVYPIAGSAMVGQARNWGVAAGVVAGDPRLAGQFR